MVLFISLTGFHGLPCLIFLNSVYIFNVNGWKMIIDQTIKLGQCPKPFLMSFREMLGDKADKIETA